jgi:hypothetical protein
MVQAGKPDDATRIARGEDRAVMEDTINAIARAYADQGSFENAETWARKLSPGPSLDQLLADISARAACRTSAEARWIVVFSVERELAGERLFSRPDHLPPSCGIGPGG